MNIEPSNGRGRALALGQGLYFAATGIWPLVHMPSFEAVTGPKTDKWLVRTVGVLVAVIGGVLVAGAARRTVSAETAALAIGSAAGLGAIDTIYAGIICIGFIALLMDFALRAFARRFVSWQDRIA